MKNRSGQFAPPGTDKIVYLKEFLAQSWYLEVPLWSYVQETETAIRQLTDQQFRFLYDVLPRFNEKVVVTGPPGSGKTILAMTVARRLAERSKLVWLTGGNMPFLNKWLQTHFEENERLLVGGFDDLYFAAKRLLQKPAKTDHSREPRSIG